MKLGCVLPFDVQETGALRTFIQGIESLGYDVLGFPDHVVGGNPATHGDMFYSYQSFFHEPVAAMGFASAITSRIKLMPDVAILPQRQTVLFAKQFAELDVLSAGRVQVGVGVGWNKLEYDALGKEFENRGKRVDEQIKLLRLLWRDELVTFEGQWEKIIDAGINPLPLRRHIPLFFGGWSDIMIRRIVRSGDGWLLYEDDWNNIPERVAKLHETCAQMGRDPKSVEIAGILPLNKTRPTRIRKDQTADAHEMRTPEEWFTDLKRWKEVGASQVDIWTQYSGISDPGAQLDLFRRFKEVADAL